MGPLSGLKIIELAGMGPTPFCGMLFADLGADVIRVDRPGAIGKDEKWDLRGRNKRSIALNLKSKEGIRAFQELCASADALIEGYRPGVAERLHVGPEDCWKINPALVYGRATGWGQDGPLAQIAGHDINYVALTGALDMIGPADGAPLPPLNLVGDYGGGAMFLAFGVLAALQEAGRTGKGQVVDAAMVDGVNSLLNVFYGFNAEGTLRFERGSNRLDGGTPWYTTYMTSDGKYMAVGALEPQFYDIFVTALGIASDGLPNRSDREAWPQLRAKFAARFLERSRDEWDELFSSLDACVSPVLNLDEAVKYPHNAERGSAVEVEGVLHPRPAPRFPAHSELAVTPPVPSGRDTCEILAELGWSEQQIAENIAAGNVATL